MVNLRDPSSVRELDRSHRQLVDVAAEADAYIRTGREVPGEVAAALTIAVVAAHRLRAVRNE